jgi:hypothetical protein
MIINGIVYGYPVHMQQDPFVCDPPRRSPSGPAVWRAHGGFTASGQADGETTPPASTPPASTPPASTPPTSTPPTSTPPAVAASAAEAEKLDRLRSERSDHLVFIGALLTGVAIGLWIEGK